MDYFVWARDLILGHLQSVFNIGQPYGPIALGGALLFTVLFYVDARKKSGRRMSVADFFRSIFPARIVWHPSSRLDVRLWIDNTLVIASAFCGAPAWCISSPRLSAPTNPRHGRCGPF
jgi:hypothetical protein